MSQSDDFRQNAAECQQQAQKSLLPDDKKQWLKLAEHWLKLADAIEQSGLDNG